MPRRIYLDNNASTQPLPEVVEAMARVLTADYANPSSAHPFGQTVRHQVEQAREQVAALIGAHPQNILFTSGGTEGVNTAIRGWFLAHPKKRRLITTRVEHACVLDLADTLAREAYAVDYVGVDSGGGVDEAELISRLDGEGALLSLIHANNETGVTWDVARWAAIAAEAGVGVHVDAVQSAGRIPITVADGPIDLLSISAHKFHGPKGVGALYLKNAASVGPLLRGGGQERGLRGGTENVAGIIGMGVAAEAALRELKKFANDPLHPSAGADRSLVAALRDRLERGIVSRVPAARVNAANAPRLSNTTNISFVGREAELLLILLGQSGVSASSGSACSSGSLEPSHVLTAMNLPHDVIHSAIRFSVSQFNTAEEIDAVVELIPQLVSRIPSLPRSE